MGVCACVCVCVSKKHKTMYSLNASVLSEPRAEGFWNALVK